MYRVELEQKTSYCTLYNNEHLSSSAEVKDFLANCIEDGWKAVKVVREFKDGRAKDVTSTYIK